MGPVLFITSNHMLNHMLEHRIAYNPNSTCIEGASQTQYASRIPYCTLKDIGLPP